MCQSARYDGQHYFGHGNGALLTKDCHEHREITGFYSMPDNNAIHHFYINQKYLLEKLREYFLIQAADLIEETEQERILLAQPLYSKRSTKVSSFKANHSVPQASGKRILVFNRKTRLPIYLAPQRGLCLLLLVQRKSTKKIADSMSLSVRTVEYYLNILRNELGCCSSKELIASYQYRLMSC